jgi:hypothetical protein
MGRKQIFYFIQLLSVLALARAHSFVIVGQGKGQGRRTDFGRTREFDESNPCGQKKIAAKNQFSNPFKRGDAVPFKWPRNNHPGGFIRLSVVPQKDSGSQKAFNGTPIQLIRDD